LALLIFFAFVWVGAPEKGKVAAFSFVALAGVTGLHWLHRAQTWFRGIIAVFLLLHILLIFIPDWRNERGSALLTFGPAAILDFACMTLVIALWLRTIGR